MEYSIGELLRRYRTERGLTQGEVAERMNYHPATISRLENGQLPIKSDFIEEFIQTVELTKAEAPVLRNSLAANANKKKDWGTCRNVLQFYGRSQEINQLKVWADDDEVNLIGIMGMGGVGKTSIAAYFVKEHEAQFEQIVCRDLTNPFTATEFVYDISSSLADQPLETPNSFGQAMLELMAILRSKRCLIMLDNFESVMHSIAVGHFRPEFKEYEDVIRNLALGDHQSKVIFTSRHLPNVITPHNGRMVRLLQLKGLDNNASLKILAEKGIEVDEALMIELVERFSGNPLALEIVADLIRESYQKDIATYLEEWPAIQDLLYEILPKHLQGFSKDEIEILLWLAIKRRPLTAVELSRLIEPKLSIGNIVLNIRKLTNRSLIQAEFQGVTLHNMIMESMQAHLQKMICDEFEKGEYECLNRFNLVDTKLPEYIQQAQRRDMLQPICQDLQRRIGSLNATKDALLQLLTQLQQGELNLVPRYLAGNVINLLIEIGFDLTGLNLSNLVLRHVDFREADLQSVKLQGAALHDCLFQEMFGHVLKVSYSPNGRLYAIATANGQIHIWDANTDQKVQILEVDANWVRSFDWHPTKPQLVTASSGQKTPLIKVWDLKSGKQLRAFSGHQNHVRSIRFANEGQLIVSGSEDNTIKIWDENGESLRTISNEDVSVWAIAIHPKETLVAVAGADEKIRLWDYETEQLVNYLEGHTDWVTAVTFNKDGTQLASGSRDGTARIWDMAHWDSLMPLEGHNGWVRDIAFVNGKKQLATVGADGTLRLWNTTLRLPMQVIPAHESLVESVGVSPEGKRLITGSQNNEVRIWEGNECIHRLVGYKNPMWSVQFSPNGHSILSGSSDGVMREWQWQEEQSPRTFEGHDDWVKGVAYHSTLPIIASGSSDRSVILWNQYSGQKQATLSGHSSWISGIDFSPNGRYLASSSGDGTVRLWNGRTGEHERELLGKDGRLWLVKFSPSGQYIVSSDDKDQILVWETRTGNLLHVLKKHTASVYAFAFSDDEQFLYSGGADGVLMIWDVDSWEYQDAIEMTNNAAIWSIAVQPFGHNLALGLVDGNVQLIDTQSRQTSYHFSISSHPIWCVTFSPDGQMIASCGDGETIQLWDIDSRSLKAQLQAKRPYEALNIIDVKGLTSAQIKTLTALGATK